MATAATLTTQRLHQLFSSSVVSLKQSYQAMVHNLLRQNLESSIGPAILIWNGDQGNQGCIGAPVALLTAHTLLHSLSMSLSKRGHNSNPRARAFISRCSQDDQLAAPPRLCLGLEAESLFSSPTRCNYQESTAPKVYPSTYG